MFSLDLSLWASSAPCTFVKRPLSLSPASSPVHWLCLTATSSCCFFNSKAIHSAIASEYTSASQQEFCGFPHPAFCLGKSGLWGSALGIWFLVSAELIWPLGLHVVPCDRVDLDHRSPCLWIPPLSAPLVMGGTQGRLQCSGHWNTVIHGGKGSQTWPNLIFNRSFSSFSVLVSSFFPSKYQKVTLIPDNKSISRSSVKKQHTWKV